MTKDIGARKRRAVWNKTNGRCWYCGVETLDTDYEEADKSRILRQFQIDHLIPRKRGGTHAIENLVPACRYCNSAKRDRLLEDFRFYCAWKNAAGFIPTEEMFIYFEDMCGLTLPHPEKSYEFYGETGELSDRIAMHDSQFTGEGDE